MSTYTFTGTATYSVSDVKAVMQNTFEDIIGFANRGMLSFDNAKQWIDDLTYLLSQKVLKVFELQLFNNSARFKSYRYEVDSNGLLSSGSQSGGIDYFSLPSTAIVRLYADLDQSDNSKYQRALEELGRRGWGTSGSKMDGTATYERNYVSNNLQLKRSVIS